MTVEFWFWAWLWTYLCAGACVTRTVLTEADTGWNRIGAAAFCVCLWPLVFVLGDKT